MADTPSKAAFGTGLLAPLRRQAGRDFVSGSDADLVASCLRQIFGTEKGDLPWAPGRGGGLRRFRNQNMTDGSQAELCAHVTACITQYEPRARILNVLVEKDGKAWHVVVQWVLVSATDRGNSGGVAASPETTRFQVTA